MAFPKRSCVSRNIQVCTAVPVGAFVRCVLKTWVDVAPASVSVVSLTSPYR